MDNLFHDLPDSLPDELSEVLGKSEHVRIERIVSTGQCSPPGHWYDQQQDEWVVVLSGAARLEFADGSTREMTIGDYLLIPAHQKHRVDWTTADEPTVWLAVFF
ncbi:cupin domain-containing protein [Stieleria sp. TO1_6]|uniref:cupin domain-containing protein n=1 Tax=Stieleria tagensis TaxID=2956795 RepID=UPI00209B006D|nr:cupin domain-containing protein [Stieleria tagensis]MCO8124685.1 cupin domain-containing protein [Stieleria tagensis]